MRGDDDEISCEDDSNDDDDGGDDDGDDDSYDNIQRISSLARAKAMHTHTRTHAWFLL